MSEFDGQVFMEQFWKQYTKEECICPRCKCLHDMLIEQDYVNNPRSWRINGIIVRVCLICAKKQEPKAKEKRGRRTGGE